jgi:predicted enzyme related to lactoylglutathione lyase
VAPRIDLTLDCAHPTQLAEFWKLALATQTNDGARIVEELERLTSAGGTALQEFAGHHVVMADPEGNEFCVA